jgi:DNA repair protein RadC
MPIAPIGSGLREGVFDPMRSRLSRIAGQSSSGARFTAAEPKGSARLSRRRRLQDRVLAGRAEDLPDFELLETLLFAAQPRADVGPLAKGLLARFRSLPALMTAEPGALLEAGLNGTAVATIKASREAALRVARAELQKRPVINSSDKLLDYCSAHAAHASVEEFHVLFLDRKNVLVLHERQQRGTLDHTPVYPREVVKRALELNASALILVHNHPSGDPTPSKADIAVTQEIRKAAGLLGIAVHDHLIVARNRQVSFRDLGLL